MTLAGATLLTSLALSLLAAPLTAEAQPAAGKIYRIVLLRAASPQPADIEAFRQGLRDLGHIERCGNQRGLTRGGVRWHER